MPGANGGLHATSGIFSTWPQTDSSVIGTLLLRIVLPYYITPIRLFAALRCKTKSGWRWHNCPSTHIKVAGWWSSRSVSLSSEGIRASLAILETQSVPLNRDIFGFMRLGLCNLLLSLGWVCDALESGSRPSLCTQQMVILLFWRAGKWLRKCRSVAGQAKHSTAQF